MRKQQMKKEVAMAHQSPGLPLFHKLIVGFFGPMLKSRFIGGVDIPSVLEIGRKYRKQGFEVSYDLMLEHVTTCHEVNVICTTLATLTSEMDGGSYGNIVIKPSMLGLHVEEDSPDFARALFARNLEWLLRVVTKKFPLPHSSVDIEIDAESRALLSAQYDMVTSVRHASPAGIRLRQAVQMHHADLALLVEAYDFLHAPIRIVKGSGVYAQDGANVISEKQVREQFRSTALRSLQAGSHPYLATMRDRAFILELTEYLHLQGFAKDTFTIEMLHGVGTALAHELRDRGYTVRIYIPFVMPWCPHAWKGYVGRRITMFLKLFYQWSTCFLRNET